MRKWMVLVLALMGISLSLIAADAVKSGSEPVSLEKKSVYVLPIQDDIMPPMVYLVRRGVKEAMQAEADLLLVHMDTNGGRVDSTQEIMEVLSRFPGETATFIDKKAYSAGSFISAATETIYMAPESFIGAAAPIMMSPGGGGVEQMPNTMEVKITSALSAPVRAAAEKNGHDPSVFEAMIDKNKELIKISYTTNDTGQVTSTTNVLCAKGEILTLTDTEASREYGDPTKPLVSAGTKGSLEEVIAALGFAGAQITEVKPTDMEKLGTWLTAISPILLIIGIIGLYIEFKTPGFGLPGIVGALAIGLYFLSGYVAGLSGLEWVILFFIGLALVVVELFVFPGTVIIGLAGAAMMLVSIVLAFMDAYPNPGPGPSLPTIPNFGAQLTVRMQDLLISLVGGIIAVWILSRILPKTRVYSTLVSQTASGMNTEAKLEEESSTRLGQEGVAISQLRPGGKAQFGDDILDVVSQGEQVTKGTRVKIIGSRGSDALVEVIQ